MKIQMRASLTMLLLVVLLSMAAAAAAWWQGRGVGRLLDEHALESARSIQQFAEGSRRRELALKSEILATNPGFVGYVSQALAAGAEPGGTVDVASIRDLLEERRSQYGFDVAAVLDPGGGVVVMLGDALRTRQDFSNLPLMLKVRAGAPAESDLLLRDGRLVLVTLSPMLRGATIEALLLTGIEIGDAFVAEIGRAAQVDAALVAPTRDGFIVLASTLEVADHPELAAAVGAERPMAAGAAQEDSVREFSLALGDGRTRASATPLFGAPATALLVGIVPTAQRVVSTAAIRTPLLIAVAVVLAVLLLGGVLIQRGLVRPLTHVVEMSERVLRGDIQVAVRNVGKGDIALIAAAFNQVLAGLRGYKEAIEKRNRKS